MQYLISAGRRGITGLVRCPMSPSGSEPKGDSEEEMVT